MQFAPVSQSVQGTEEDKTTRIPNRPTDPFTFKVNEGQGWQQPYGIAPQFYGQYGKTTPGVNFFNPRPNQRWGGGKDNPIWSHFWQQENGAPATWRGNAHQPFQQGGYSPQQIEQAGQDWKGYRQGLFDTHGVGPLREIQGNSPEAIGQAQNAFKDYRRELFGKYGTGPLTNLTADERTKLGGLKTAWNDLAADPQTGNLSPEEAAKLNQLKNTYTSYQARPAPTQATTANNYTLPQAQYRLPQRRQGLLGGNTAIG